MRRNPYLARLPIRNPEDFYGRSQEVARLYELISASFPNSVSVCGSSRIGKSSLARYIAHPQVASRFLTDASRYVFIQITMNALPQPSAEGFIARVLRELATVINDDRLASLPSTTQGLEDALRALRTAGRRLVLILDEFEPSGNEPGFDQSFYDFLRWLPNEYDVAYLIFSRIELEYLCRSGRVPSERFFAFFTPIILGAFTEAEAAEFIRDSSTKAGCPLTSYIDDILLITGLWPFFIQIGCSKLFDKVETILDRRRLLRVTEQEFVQEAKQQFPLLWKGLTSEEQAICRAVARGEAFPDTPLVSLLTAKGYLRRTKSRWRLLCPVFESFVKEYGDVLPKKPSGAIGEVYEILREIGHGAMGRVYKVQHRMTTKVSALKVLRSDLATDPQFRERFFREIRLAAQVDHPNIVRVEFAGEDNGVPYFVMEFVDGQGLDKLIPEQHGIAQDLVIEIGMQMAQALMELHKRGLIHRDIKPSNIILGRNKVAKLADFGLARLAAERVRLTQAGDILGTLNYMSPEQKAGQELDIRSDIFSLGLTLAHLLLGNTGFVATRGSENPNQALDEELTQMMRVNRLSRGTVEVIRKMTAPARESRYQNPQTLYADLRAVYKELLSAAGDVTTEAQS